MITESKLDRVLQKLGLARRSRLDACEDAYTNNREELQMYQAEEHERESDPLYRAQMRAMALLDVTATGPEWGENQIEQHQIATLREGLENMGVTFRQSFDVVMPTSPTGEPHTYFAPDSLEAWRSFAGIYGVVLHEE